MRRLLLAVLVVAALAGCGQSNPDLIPADRALTATRAQIRAAERELDQLPRAVDSELKQNLQDWIDRIDSRISDDCRAEETATPEPTETSTATPTGTATAT